MEEMQISLGLMPQTASADECLGRQACLGEQQETGSLQHLAPSGGLPALESSCKLGQFQVQTEAQDE